MDQQFDGIKVTLGPDAIVAGAERAVKYEALTNLYLAACAYKDAVEAAGDDDSVIDEAEVLWDSVEYAKAVL